MENNCRDMKNKITELYMAYADSLFAYSFGVLGHYEEARDIVADTFMKALGERKFLDEDFNARAWLYRVATNLMNNYFSRFARRFFSYSNRDLDLRVRDEAGVHEKMARNENFKRLTESLRKMERIDSEMIYLKFFENMTYSDIAKIFGMPDSTVASRITRAVRGMADELER